ncbi:hypothetical protein [Adhaeribacter aerolatus]|uniref:hypothetical protein n=1 Tax=Adhaeribacter aerolatus TaxID=670289 RepID=UPI0011BE4EC1|nr:hypothetical protein [Adhaeribacter aerolatus]
MTYFFYLLNVLVVGGLCYLIWQRELASPLKKYLLPALVLKITSGILLGVFYQVYFGGGDIQVFQDQANLVTEYARVSPASYVRLLLTRKFESETLRSALTFYWYSNSYFTIMLLSFLNFLTGGHIFLNGLYFSLFSFWGLYQLVKVLGRLNSMFFLPAVIAFLFFPSVVFWSSGISKEAVYLGSLGWLIAAMLRLVYSLSGRVWLNVLFVLVAGYLLWKIKFYFAILVFALLLAYSAVIFLERRFNIFKSKRNKIILFCLTALIGGVIVSGWQEAIRIDYFIEQLINSNVVLAERSAGKPFVSFPDLQPNLRSIISHSPAAVFHVITRPFIWEGHSFFYLLAGLENLFILLLLFAALFRLFRNGTGWLNLGVVVILIYVVVIAALIGLSTPNIGSLFRYRVAVLPFLVFLLLVVQYKWFGRKLI